MAIPNDRSSPIEALTRQILDYLQKYPEAGDTLEGIATWWFQQQCIEQLVDEVAEALERLVKKGDIQTYSTSSGTIFYKKKK